ncbi:hypothetical protein CHELA1G2_30138 [Hyphomicrobiales bacterium]|nr:hypothetical protein CHELA1G2_30138 [Hyphomicrobiales bacterium]
MYKTSCHHIWSEIALFPRAASLACAVDRTYIDVVVPADNHGTSSTNGKDLIEEV